MKKHNSIRGWFAYELYQQMKKNKDIYLITPDLGYKMLDKIKEDYPDRFFNVGASEQAAVGIAIGLAQEQKIPFVYSITPFLLYRPAEWIRNYLHKENANVKLVGAGVGKDYKEDGFTHWSDEPYNTLISRWPNIRQFCPNEKEELPKIVEEMVKNNKPSFLHLRRR